MDWDCDTANVYDGSRFQHLVDNGAEQMVVFADEGFVKVNWHPSNLRICRRGQWNDRMLIETVLSPIQEQREAAAPHQSRRVYQGVETKHQGSECNRYL